MQGKRIMRSRNERLVAGVAGGLAAYLNIDPVLVRIGLVILTMFNGLGLILYLALWLLLPNEDSVAPDAGAQVRENVAEMQSQADAFVERLRGMFAR